MAKSVIFYFAAKTDDYAVSQYNYLLTTGLDIIVFLKNSETNDNSRFVSCKQVITFEPEEAQYPEFKNYINCGVHKLNLILKDYCVYADLYNQYDYVYLIEPTFRFSLNITDLFNTLSADESDLISTYIQHVKNTSVKWMWYDEFTNLYDNEKYKYVLKAYDGGFTRVSIKALNYLYEYLDPLINYFIDLSLPTLLYNNGFSIVSLSNFETDDEFKRYQFCVPSTYYYNTSEIQNSEYNKSVGLIYNTYKSLIDKIFYKQENPDITIIMPVYNEEDTIERAIESILNQVNPPIYELWCINDGSSDKTNDILDKYTSHPNVVVISRSHTGLVNSLNYGLEHATGKYIMRMDADDISLPNRLRHQFDYMESHPECDILGSSPILDWTGEEYPMGSYEITLNSLEGCNRIFHPATIMRNSSMKKLPFLYEYYYECGEDYKLWVTALLHGLRIFSDSTMVIRYSAPKSTNSKQSVTGKRIKNLIQQINNGIKNDAAHNMTAIITFRNEYDEIEKTVAAIRATTTNMPIILVNDASDNDYDYKFVADKYYCKYLHNEVPSGVAGARVDAVKMVETDYFIILDGHMRMYEQDWDLRAIEIMKQYGDNNAYFGRTVVISRDSANFSKNETAETVSNTFGACLAGEQYTLVPKWVTSASTVNFDNENENVIPVPILFGADYMMSVKFWNKINGLNGLLSWGQDETLLSLKTWLAGSKVYLIKDMLFGHVYRKKRPYNAVAIEMNSNYIYCNYLFARDFLEYRQLNYMYETHLGHNWFMKAYDVFKEHFNDTKQFKEHFFNNVVPAGCEQTMDWFWEFNYNADPNQVQDYYDKRDNILKDMPDEYGLNFEY